MRVHLTVLEALFGWESLSHTCLATPYHNTQQQKQLNTRQRYARLVHLVIQHFAAQMKWEITIASAHKPETGSKSGTKCSTTISLPTIKWTTYVNESYKRIRLNCLWPSTETRQRDIHSDGQINRQMDAVLEVIWTKSTKPQVRFHLSCS